MLRILVLFILTFSFSADFFAQAEKYHRVKIDLKGKDINQLSRLGIETDHGIFTPFRSLENDYSNHEIKMIKNAGFDVEIVIEDVVSYYKNPNRKSEFNVEFRNSSCDQEGNCVISEFKTPENYSGGSMGGYKTYSQMLLNVDSMHILYPNLITVRNNIGDTTHMGNNVFYLKISDNPDNDENEPQVLYTAIHHAREPNSMAQMLFYMWYLLENYESDTTIQNLVNNTEMYFVPCLNPDGYIINEINNPDGGGLWRKNGRVDSNGELVGVDLNRNYGFHWAFDDDGSSPNPGSQTYRGHKAFSEPETSAIAAFCESKDFQIALNYHTFGNLLIHPWGYNDQITPDHGIFKSLGEGMIHENCYHLGTGTETVGYTVNGDSDDWMYGDDTLKNKIYSMTPEVGPSFWPPQTDIISLNKACMHMNLQAARSLHNNFYIESLQEEPINGNVSIPIEITQIGLGQGAIPLTITPITSNIISNPLQTTIELNINQSDTIYYPLEINSTADSEIIELEVLLGDAVTSTIETIRLLYFKNQSTHGNIDLTEYTNYWAFSQDWALDNEKVFNGTYSLTDSPGSTYRPAANTQVNLDTIINLKDMVFASMNFYGQWDIENNYDYAVIEASNNNLDFEPLCGMHTNNGSNNQLEGQPIFDGTQNTWVYESMDLTNYLGDSTVYIRIRMVSDNFVENDGIYLDSITFNTIEKSVVSPSKDINLDEISLFPNPAQDKLYLNNYGINADLRIVNQLGQEFEVLKSDHTIKISQLPKGLYWLIIEYEGKQSVHSFIKS